MSDCADTLPPSTVYAPPDPLLEARQAFPNDGRRWPRNAVVEPYAATQWEELGEWTFQLGPVRFGPGELWCPTAVQGMGLPAMETNDISFPYAHGAVGFGDTSESRSVSVNVTGKFASSQDAWIELRRLSGAWQPSTRNQVFQMRMTGAESLILFGRPRRLEADTTNIQHGLVSVALQFQALDPRFYTGAVRDRGWEQTATATVCFDPDICLTGDEFCFSTAGSLFVLANNAGNVPAPVQITWADGVSEPSVTNAATGETWTWMATTATGDLVMDSQSRLATVDGVDRYDAVTVGSQWFWLQPGQNRLVFTQAGEVPDVTVRWRDAWL